MANSDGELIGGLLFLLATRHSLFALRSEFTAEIFGHRLDLFRRPQPAASDHAVDRGLPGAAILPRVAEHRVGMALKTLGRDHGAAGIVSCPRLLRRGARANE